MAYRKFSAAQLFDGYRMLGNDKVLITDEEGRVEGIFPRNEAGEDILESEGILSPGFINCHCHLELSHMKGAIPEKTGLIGFVYHVIRNRHFQEEEILAAITTGEREMIDNGIVAVGDICNNGLTAPQKSKASLRYQNFVEVSGFADQVAEERFQRALQIRQQFSAQHASSSIVPHAPYSVAEALWQKIVHHPGNDLLTIHNQETVAENDLFREKGGEFLSFYEKMNIDISWFNASGKTSLQTYLRKFIPGQQVILVHNVFTSAEDVSFSKMWDDLQLYWCLCPNANLYISGRLPDIDMLMKEDCPIVLGTDSLASNHQLSVLAEMKSIYEHYPSVELSQLFRWGTLNGARALRMENELGSFEKGKKPGVVLSSADLSSCRPLL